jgi:hypothetical protein
MIRPASTAEEKAEIVTYLAAEIRTTPLALVGAMPFEAAYIMRSGKPRGAVLYTNYRVHSVEMIAAGGPGWLTRGDISNAFYYAFIHLGCWTVLTMINRTNSASRELNRRLGFTELCVIETSRNKAEDVVMYGITRDRCRWLPRPPVKVAA